MIENDCNQIYFVEYGKAEKNFSKEIVISMNTEGISLHKINKLLNEKNKSLRLYSFNGVLITDDGDLEFYKNSESRNKIIFFSTNDTLFDFQDILRVFRIENKLFECENYSIFYAKQKYTSEPYILKYFAPLQDGIKIKIVYNELEKIQKLNHLNITKLYNFCLLDDFRVVLLLDYEETPSLRKLLETEGIFDEEIARKVFRQIVYGLNHIHSNNLIHGNLRPENILIDQFKNIKITEFKLSSLEQQQDIFYQSDYSYMPPERVYITDNEDKMENDIWCIGVILFEMIFGKNPFKCSNISEAKSKLKKLKIPYDDLVSYELHDILKKILVLEPDKRLKIKEILNHPWILGELLDEDFKNKKPIRRSSSLMNLLNKYNKIKIVLQSSNTLQEVELNKKTNLKNKTAKNLPKILTNKVINSNQNEICDREINLMKKGVVLPSYLEPIGHSKELKHKLGKIKEFFNNYENMKEKLEPEEKFSRRAKKSNTIVNKSKFDIEMREKNINKSVDPIGRSNRKFKTQIDDDQSLKSKILEKLNSKLELEIKDNSNLALNLNFENRKTSNKLSLKKNCIENFKSNEEGIIKKVQFKSDNSNLPSVSKVEENTYFDQNDISSDEAEQDKEKFSKTIISKSKLSLQTQLIKKSSKIKISHSPTSNNETNFETAKVLRSNMKPSSFKIPNEK